MLLFSLNIIFVILAIVTGGRDTIIFEDSSILKFDKTVVTNPTVPLQWLSTLQPLLMSTTQSLKYYPSQEKTTVQQQIINYPSQPQTTVQSQKHITIQPQTTVQPQKHNTVQSQTTVQPQKHNTIQSQITVQPQKQNIIQFQTTVPPKKFNQPQLQNTVQSSNSFQSHSLYKLQQYIQPILIPAASNEDIREMWIQSLLNATLNIDKSLNHLSTNDPKSEYNVIVSPLCLIAAMALILLGSKNETKMEIEKLFNSGKNSILSTDSYQNYEQLGMLLNYFEESNANNTLGVQVNLAKAVFIQNDYNITNYYKLVAKDYLHTELIPVNFKLNGPQTQQTINQWMSNQTHGKIDYIMPDIPLADTKMIITSALYFGGDWEYPFFPNYTRIRPFYLGSNADGKKTSKQTKECIYVPMMVGTSEVLYHKNDEVGFKAIGLPYKGKKFYSYFVLPNSNIDLRDIVSKINGTTLRKITKDTRITDFTYVVPKMTLDSYTNIRPVLQNLGINKLFNPAEADLSNMVTESNYYISDILHKVQININEFGTVASAATVVTITRGGQSTFNVNKPFIFFIYCVETDTVLFWGNIQKPTPYSTAMPVVNTHKKV